MSTLVGVAHAGQVAGSTTAGVRIGRFAVCEQLLADDIHYLFGNPGTVEQGFLDALASYPELQYVVALQETVAVGIADGYARAARRLWGALVWAADSFEVSMSAAHPHFRGLFGHIFANYSQLITVQADAVLICGTYVFPEVFPALDEVFAPQARIVHIDLDTDAIAKNHRVDLGIVSDPKLSLMQLAESLEQEMSSAHKQAAQQRSRQLALEQRQEQQTQRDADRACWDKMPMPASRFMAGLGKLAPNDIIVFDEALTTSPDLVHYLQPTRPGAYFQTRDRCLEVGVPGALGLKLAHPRQTVFGFTGDGGHVHDPGAVDRRAPPDRR